MKYEPPAEHGRERVLTPAELGPIYEVISAAAAKFARFEQPTPSGLLRMKAALQTREAAE